MGEIEFCIKKSEGKNVINYILMSTEIIARKIG